MIILAVVVSGGIGGTLIYQAAQQPNIQATSINVPQSTTYPRSSTVVNNGVVSNSGSFDYTATLPGGYAVTFDNGFSTFSSKSVSVSYNVAGTSYTKSLVVSAGTSESLSFTMSTGERLYGTFTVSGGSGNDVDFYIVAQTCTQTVSFSFTLVNSGSANGYASVQFHSDGTALWTNRYYVAQGQQIPESGSVSLSDCSAHSYQIVVSQTQKS